MSATLVIALTTLRDVLRQRLWLGMLLAWVLVVAAARAVGALELAGMNHQVAVEFALGAVSFFGAALVLILATLQCFDDLTSGRVEALWARPISRGEWLLGKWLGVMAVMAVYCAASGVGVWVVAQFAPPDAALVVEWEQAPPVLQPAGLAAAVVLQWIKLGLIAAVVLLFATYARNATLALLLSTGVVVAGHLQPVAYGIYAAQGDLGWVGRALQAWPNLQRFEPGELVWLSQVPWLQQGAVLIYGLIYILALLGAAAAALRYRDV